MTTLTSQTAAGDLAFLRTLVDEQPKTYKNAGIIYSSAGIIYGLQCLVNWALLKGQTVVPDILWLLLGFGPTVLFLIICIWVPMKSKINTHQKGIATRAIMAVFASVGIANAVMAMVFGFAAYQRGDFSLYLFFPVVVCAFQGAVWCAIAMIQRRTWMWVTAIGWFMASAFLSLTVPSAVDPSVLNYLLVLALSMFALMGAPGIIMIYGADKSA